tara:strand:+ start:3625 stop:5535 length:1911 start_codon:yes stop_codon:yes gene_type:complete
MAVNLNPGADATLVAAATKAAMANVPKDLSGTFEAMASSYASTMETVGQVYGEAAKSLGKIGGSLVKEAVKNQSNITAGDSHVLETEIEVQAPLTEEGPVKTSGLGPREDGSGNKDINPKTTTKKTTIGDELRGIRSELFSLSLKTDKKSRVRKNELRAERAQFTSDIAFLDNARKVTDEQLKSGNVNFETTGKLNLAFKQGMNALTTKTGVIADGEFEGYKLVPTRDENGKMAFMMRDNEGNFVTGKDELGNPTTKGEKPYIVPASETSNLLEMKMDQKMLDPVQKKITGQFKAGQTGLPYLGNQLVSGMRPVLDNEATLRQLSDVRFGDDTKTLRDHVNSPSEYSAKMFSEISGADLASMGVDEMADGEAGITQQDFIGSGAAIVNFNKVKSATFDKDNPNYDSGSHLKALTESHIYRTGEIMHEAGAKLYVAPKGTSTETSNPFGTKSLSIGGGEYLPATERLNRRKIVEGGKGGFDGIYGAYSPSANGWTVDKGDGPQPISDYKLLQDEKLLLPGDVDPSIKENEKEEANNKYSSSVLTNTVKGLTEEKDIMNALKEKFKDTKFTFDYTFGDGKEIVKVKHGDGEYKEFTLSGDIGQRIADYMNIMDPKVGATMPTKDGGTAKWNGTNWIKQ